MVLKKIVFDKENNFWFKLKGKIFDFCINKKPATFVILIGKNGCGKTMLLNFLLQVFSFHKRIYPFSDNNNYWVNNSVSKEEDKKVVVLLFNDNNYEVELYLSSRISNNGSGFTFFIDNFGWAKDFFTWKYCLVNSSYFSARNDNFLRKDGRTNEFFYQIDDPISSVKLGVYSKPSLQKTIIREINCENETGKLFNISNKPSKIDNFLDDDLYVHNEKTRELLNGLLKLKLTHKISDLLNERHNLKYDENKKLIYEEEEFYYPINSLSSGKKRNFSLTVFFELFFHDLKKFNKNNIFSFLFDEIEKSLCPFEQQKMAEQIINYGGKMGGMKRQFFITTHSPFILKNFLNRDDTVIINVENGENILKSEKKKLLLDKNDNVSYDEMSYLYYDIVTSSYYISLYEELMGKVDVESYFEMDDWLKTNKNKINKIIKEKKSDKVIKIEKIKCIKHYKLNNNGEIKEKYSKNKDVDLWKDSTNLTRLRHMFAHAWTKEKNFLFYKNHPEKFKNNNDKKILKTNEFYSFFKNKNIANEEIESLLRKYIELMRLILLNYYKITK